MSYTISNKKETHLKQPEKINNACDLFAGFRNYLHYHIIASKTSLHARMRARVGLLLKALNRANPKNEAAEKTAGRRNTKIGGKGLVAAKHF